MADSKLRANNNWGNVAVGVRIGKHPEAAFFQSWTAFLMRGLRGGDTVLTPASYMPAHQAANQLVRQFMDSGRDSLLLVDDDMEFQPTALERLRTNPANGAYDIAFAFCTHRTWPPKPVMLRLDEQQPTGPEAARGEHYHTVYDFRDGDVVPVDMVGLAFTLIKRRVFEAMTDPALGVDFSSWFSYGPGFESDDVAFCRNARQLGFTMAVDTNVKINHLGVLGMGWTEFLAWAGTPRLRANGDPPAAGQNGDSVDYEMSEADFRLLLLAAADAPGEAGALALKLLGGVRESAH